MSAGQTANGDQAAYQARHARDDRHTMATTVQPRWAGPAPSPQATNRSKRWDFRVQDGHGGTDQDTLKDIERRDPDGYDNGYGPPKAAEYKAHKDWAVNKHGKQAWNDYKKGGWAPQPEV